MQKAHDASKNNWWRNFPNIDTPITQDQLNRNETTVDMIDDRVVAFDTSKANQTDLLQSIKDVDFDDETGIFTFTRWNGTTFEIDTPLEKVVTNFTYDSNPQSPHYQNLILTLEDGTVEYIDMSALVTEYDFVASDTIQPQVNNGQVRMNVINGSITGEKLEPNYLADCVLAKQGAEAAEANAQTSEETALTHQYNAEAWAKGTKNNVPVTPTDAQYHDNAWYWAQQARAIVGDKVDSFNGRTGTVLPADGDYSSNLIAPATGAIPGQVPVVRNVGTGQDIKLEYVNEDLDIGLKPHIIVISETGSTVTLTKGTKVIYADETSPEHFEADVTEFGTWVIDSILSGDDAQVSLVVDAVKIYTVDDSHWHADITVTYPTGGTCSCSKSGTTTLYATGSPYTFTVHESGTYTITATANGETYTTDVEITTSGQTESLTIPEGSTVTPTDSVATLLSCAGIHDTSITSVSDLLADTTTLLAVINSENAVDYLVRSTTFASGAVPIMTSNTTPSGTCIQSGAESGYYAYSAFDGIDTTDFLTSAAIAGAYVGYTFPSAKRIVKCKAHIATNATAESHYTYKIQGSNNGSNWTDLADAFSVTLSGQGSTWVDIDLDATNTYTSYRLIHPSTMESSRRMRVYTLQFYEADAVFTEDSTAMSYIGLNNYAANTLLADETWCEAICNSEYFESVLNVKVPAMTSNTTPSGECFGVAQSSNYYYKSFDGSSNGASYVGATHAVGYMFPEKKRIYKFHFEAYSNQSTAQTRHYYLDGSDDGTTYAQIKDIGNISTVNRFDAYEYNINANNKYFKLYTTGSASYTWAYSKVQFYGREDV